MREHAENRRLQYAAFNFIQGRGGGMLRARLA